MPFPFRSHKEIREESTGQILPRRPEHRAGLSVDVDYPARETVLFDLMEQNSIIDPVEKGMESDLSSCAEDEKIMRHTPEFELSRGDDTLN